MARRLLAMLLFPLIAYAQPPGKVVTPRAKPPPGSFVVTVQHGKPPGKVTPLSAESCPWWVDKCCDFSKPGKPHCYCARHCKAGDNIDQTVKVAQKITTTRKVKSVQKIKVVQKVKTTRKIKIIQKTKPVRKIKVAHKVKKTALLGSHAGPSVLRCPWLAKTCCNFSTPGKPRCYCARHCKPGYKVVKR